MEGLDTDMQNIRFPDLVLGMLRNAAVTSVEGLLHSNRLLTEVRTHLNPIQLAKLNKLIQKNNQTVNDKEGRTQELYKSTGRDILRERDFEGQCVEELNRMTDAPEAVQKLITLYQSRVDLLSSLPCHIDKDACAGVKRSRKEVCDSPSPGGKGDLNTEDQIELERKEKMVECAEPVPVLNDKVGDVDTSNVAVSTNAVHVDDQKPLTEAPNPKDDMSKVSPEQQRVNERRESLLLRLANMCKYTAVYNRKVEETQNWRRHWTRRKSMFEMNLMWPYQTVTKREWQEVRHNLNHEKNALNKDEQALKRYAETFRTDVMDWNTDVMRLNEALTKNTTLAASLTTETVILHKSQDDAFALVTQHSQLKIVQPGEYLEDYHPRVEEAQTPKR